jgi:hypothetical protein
MKVFAKHFGYRWLTWLWCFALLCFYRGAAHSKMAKNGGRTPLFSKAGNGSAMRPWGLLLPQEHVHPQYLAISYGHHTQISPGAAKTHSKYNVARQLKSLLDGRSRWPGFIFFYPALFSFYLLMQNFHQWKLLSGLRRHWHPVAQGKFTKHLSLKETFEKCFPLKRDSSSRMAKILTTPYDLQDLRGRHEYMEYFEDKAKASLRAKCWAWPQRNRLLISQGRHRNWAKGGVLQRSLKVPY